jgi:hypothetical protein
MCCVSQGSFRPHTSNACTQASTPISSWMPQCRPYSAQGYINVYCAECIITYIILRWGLFRIPRVKHRHQYQSRFWPLHSLDRIKHFHRAFVVHLFRAFRPAFASCPSREIHDILPLEGFSEVCNSGILKRK